MAMPESILPMADLRDALGVAGDEMDTVLEDLRSAAIEELEKRVRRNVLDRPAFNTTAMEFLYRPLGGNVDAIIFRVPDVKSIEAPGLRYRAKGADPTARGSQTLTIDFSSDRVGAGESNLVIYSPANDLWRDRMEFDHPAPSIRVTAGMDASEVPSAWQRAVALMVRAVYDGSAFDDLGKNNPMDRLLMPWTRQAGDDAGI